VRKYLIYINKKNGIGGGVVGLSEPSGAIEMRLQNQVAIVTGAASGFGAEIARTYVAEGAKVVLADINFAGAQTLAAALGDRTLAVKCDVTKRADIEALVALAVDRFGTVDIVVNNAGTTHKNRPMLEVDEASFDRVFAVNVKSIYYMTLCIVPLMRQKKRGVIINIGSTGGLRPRPGLVWYNTSKGAVNVMSKALAIELATDGIRVNAICPVMGESALLESFMGGPDTPENRQKIVASIPLGRLAKPIDVANAAVFLASADAEFITGIEFPVDGGRTI
jgi:3-oxoacyl-[acyl-carrier protein] reductase